MPKCGFVSFSRIECGPLTKCLGHKWKKAPLIRTCSNLNSIIWRLTEPQWNWGNCPDGQIHHRFLFQVTSSLPAPANLVQVDVLLLLLLLSSRLPKRIPGFKSQLWRGCRFVSFSRFLCLSVQQKTKQTTKSSNSNKNQTNKPKLALRCVVRCVARFAVNLRRGPNFFLLFFINKFNKFEKHFDLKQHFGGNCCVSTVLIKYVEKLS